MHPPPIATLGDPADLRPMTIGSAAGPLIGSWAAVQWEYARAGGGAVVDLIADLAAP